MALTKKLSLLCMSILTAGFVAESDAMNFKSDAMNFMGTGAVLGDKTTSIYKNNYEKLSSKNKNSIFGKPFKELSELPASNYLLTFSDILDVVDEAKTNANKHKYNTYKYDVLLTTIKQQNLINKIKRILQAIDLDGQESAFMNRVSEIMEKYGVVVDWNSKNQFSKPKFTINQFSKDLLSSFTSGDADNSTGVASVYKNLIQMYTSNKQANNNKFSEYIMQFMILDMNVEQKWNLFKLCQQKLTEKKHHSFINSIMLHLMYQLSGILSYDVLQDNASGLTDQIVLEAIRLQRAIAENNDQNYSSIYSGLPQITDSIPNFNTMQKRIQNNIREYIRRPRLVAPLFGTACVESKLLDLLYCQYGVEKIAIDNTNYNYYFKNQAITNAIQAEKNRAIQKLNNILFGNNSTFEDMEYTIFGNIALDKQKNQRSVRRFSRIKNDVDSIRINLPYRKPLPVGNIVKSGTKTKPVGLVNLKMLEAIITNELDNESNKPTNNQQTIKLLEELNSAGNSKFYDIFRTLFDPSSEAEKNVSKILKKQVIVHDKEQVLAPSRKLELNKVEATGNFLESISNHLQKNQNAVQLLLTCDMYDNFKKAHRIKRRSNINLPYSVIQHLGTKRAAASTKVHYIGIDRDDIANILADVYSTNNSSSRSQFLKCFKLLPAFYLNNLFKYIIDNEHDLTINDLYIQLAELIINSVNNQQYFVAISLQQGLPILNKDLSQKLNNDYLVQVLVGEMANTIQTKLADILNKMTAFAGELENSYNIPSQPQAMPQAMSQAILKLVGEYNRINSFTYNPIEILGDVNHVIETIIHDVNSTYGTNLTNNKKIILDCINSVYSQGLRVHMLVKLVSCVLQVALNNMLETFVYNKDGNINLADVLYYLNNNDNTATTKDLITDMLDSDPYLRFITQEPVDTVRELNDKCNGEYLNVISHLPPQQPTISSKTISSMIEKINEVVSNYSVDLSVANISAISSILSSFEKHNSGILSSLDGLGFYCLVKYIDQRIASRSLEYNVGKEKLYYGDYYRIQLIYSIWQITNQNPSNENSQDSLVRSVSEAFFSKMLGLCNSGDNKQLLVLSNLAQNSDKLRNPDDYSQSYAESQVGNYIPIMKTQSRNNNPQPNIDLNQQNMVQHNTYLQNQGNPTAPNTNMPPHAINPAQITQQLGSNYVENPVVPITNNQNMQNMQNRQNNPTNKTDVNKTLNQINSLKKRLQELKNIKTGLIEEADIAQVQAMISNIENIIKELEKQIPGYRPYNDLANGLRGTTYPNMPMNDDDQKMQGNENDLNNENMNINNGANNKEEFQNQENDLNNDNINNANEGNELNNTNWDDSMSINTTSHMPFLNL